MMAHFPLGLLLAAIIGLLGWRVGALTRSGALGAALIGGAVFGFGGPTWGAVLIAFFISSSLLSFFRKGEKTAVADEYAKTDRRDLGQTLANGGVAALLAIGAGIVTRDSPWYPTLTLAYFGALSAATADTWATELGVLSARSPRLITTGAVVPAGVSGGVTPLGLLASLAGGLFIGASAFLLIQMASLLTTGAWFLQDWFLLILCATAGLAGSLVDSVAGALWQRMYYCDVCQTPTERKEHRCGQTARPFRGLSWLGNDQVNFLATIAGALTAALLSPLFF